MNRARPRLRDSRGRAAGARVRLKSGALPPRAEGDCTPRVGNLGRGSSPGRSGGRWVGPPGSHRRRRGRRPVFSTSGTWPSASGVLPNRFIVSCRPETSMDLASSVKPAMLSPPSKMLLKSQISLRAPPLQAGTARRRERLPPHGARRAAIGSKQAGDRTGRYWRNSSSWTTAFSSFADLTLTP